MEYFEDLRNINHCEFILMQKNAENGKYVLQNQLRTWSELKRQRAAEQAAKVESERAHVSAAQQARLDDPRIKDPQRRNTLSSFLQQVRADSPDISPDIQEEKPNEIQLPTPGQASTKEAIADGGLLVEASGQISHPGRSQEGSSKQHADGSATPVMDSFQPPSSQPPYRPAAPTPTTLFHRLGSNGGGTPSGGNTPHEMSDDEEYFNQSLTTLADEGGSKSIARAMRKPQRKPTPEDVERWAAESGMGAGQRADALGDGPSAESERVGPDEDLTKAKAKGQSLIESVY